MACKTKHVSLHGFLKSSIIFGVTTFSWINYAQSIEDFYTYFKSANYFKALESLDTTPFKKENLHTKFYLKGLTENKLQKFDQSILSFTKALQLGSKAEDIHYEFGQAYYATNDIKNARNQFLLSAKNNYNKPLSYYYVGHTSQMLEEYQRAKDAFSFIIKDPSSDEKILQIARFQLAETLLIIGRNKIEGNSFDPESNAEQTGKKAKDDPEFVKIVEKYVLPLMSQAYETDKTTSVAPEIQARIKEIKIEFQLDPDLMKNGRRISSKRYALSLMQKIKFDTNVTLANDQSTVTQSKKESYVFDSEFYAKRDFVFRKQIISSLDFKILNTKYSDTKNSAVYQNNSYSFYGNLKNKFEHTLFERPASLLFDWENSYVARDKFQEKKRRKYATSKTFSLGEKFRYFSFGDSSVKLKYKDYEAYLRTLNNKTLTFSYDQTVITKRQHLMIFLLNIDTVDSYNAKNNSTNSLLFRTDYLIPEFIPSYTIGFALSLTLLDPKRQKTARGIESTKAYSIDISRDLSTNLKVGFNMEFTSNSSDSQSYDYKKEVITTEVKYNF